MRLRTVLNRTPEIPKKRTTDYFQPDEVPRQKPQPQPRIVTSSVDSRPDIGTGLGFRSWTYPKFRISPDPNVNVTENICGDTGCSRSLVGRKYLASHYPSVQVCRRLASLSLEGIGSAIHQSSDYVILPFYLLSTLPSTNGSTTSAFARFQREVAIVENLDANLLLGMNTLVRKASISSSPVRPLSFSHATSPFP